MPGILVDLLDHPGLVLELIDGVLQLLIQHAPIRHYHDRMEDLFILVAVQGGQSMRQPGDGVRLTRARRMLDQIVVTGAMRHGMPNERAHPVELVIARKDQRLPADRPRAPLGLACFSFTSRCMKRCRISSRLSV